MPINYVLIRRWLYYAATALLAALGSLQAREGDYVAAAMAGLGALVPLLAAANTKAPLEPRDPAITEE